jgi:hypothetical protein
MLGIEYSPCYHCDKTKCSFCELTRYKDSQQKKEASEMAELKTCPIKEVVRCRDCKYSYFVKSCSKYECRKGCGTLKYSNDFCSYGERRENNDKG